MAAAIAGATETDVDVANRLGGYPRVSVRASTGSPVDVPADWESRARNGERVVGVSVYLRRVELDESGRPTAGRELLLADADDARLLSDAEVARLGLDTAQVLSMRARRVALARAEQAGGGKPPGLTRE